jgi:fused signal recognition particle receptor
MSRSESVSSRAFESRSEESAGLAEQLASAGFDPGDDEAWERLEEALLRSDVGVPATAESSAASARRRRRPRTRSSRRSRRSSALLLARTRWEAERGAGRRRERNGQDDHDRQLAEAARHGRSVLVGAADLPRGGRGAARDWAERAGADFVGSRRGADPAAVAFDAVEARVLASTTSRLSTRQAAYIRNRT